MSAADFLAQQAKSDKRETGAGFLPSSGEQQDSTEVKKKNIWSSLDDWLRSECVYERIHVAVMARESARQRR